MSKSSSRVDDLLWKSILEQTFAHFLEFFFSDEAAIFDLSKPFDYLDKEFESLFPPEPNGKGVRFVDKLVKVYLKDGSEQFVKKMGLPLADIAKGTGLSIQEIEKLK